MNRKLALVSITALAATGVGALGASTIHADGTTPPPWDFYDVPQLGTEPVRGSGCGGDGSIGDVIPDGYWRGYMTSVDQFGGTMQFDLVCVYLTPQDSTIETVPDGYLSNNNARTRTVPLAPSFRFSGTRYQPDGTVPFFQTVGMADGGNFDGDNVPYEGTDSWLYVENGQAQWVIGAPVSGGSMSDQVVANAPQPAAPMPSSQIVNSLATYWGNADGDALCALVVESNENTGELDDRWWELVQAYDPIASQEPGAGADAWGFLFQECIVNAGLPYS